MRSPRVRGTTHGQCGVESITTRETGLARRGSRSTGGGCLERASSGSLTPGGTDETNFTVDGRSGCQRKCEWDGKKERKPL